MILTRNERLKELCDAFDGSAKALTRISGGLSCEITPIYKGKETVENIEYRFARIFYNSFIIEFKYTARGIMGVVNSVLNCSISCYKNGENEVFIPLELFLDYLDIGYSSPLTIPYITDKDEMLAAFEHIGTVIKNSFSSIMTTMTDEEERRRINDVFLSEIAYILKINTEKNDIFFYINENLYSFFTIRHTTSYFAKYIQGKRKKAIRELEKIKLKTGYENRLLALWKNGDEHLTELLSFSKDNLNNSQLSTDGKGAGRELCAFFLSWVVLSILFAPFYFGFYFLLFLIEGMDSVYLMGPIYNSPLCILFAFLTAIAVSYFVRLRVYKLLFPKHYENYKAVDQVQNGKGADKFIKVLLSIIIVAGLLGSFLLVRWNLNFKADGFIDNSEFLSINGDYYEYAEIEKVYYKSYRFNSFDERLDFPSYVVRLKDGTEIDLYELGELEDYGIELIDFLEENGVRVERPS